ncbi:MAG: hypothetical protein EA415_02525 [Sphaerobacteraceae bacterium]|nr:MAG: hypothetical protein EA415_02525 [Sphaerobacteraceae bacterium]
MKTWSQKVEFVSMWITPTSRLSASSSSLPRLTLARAARCGCITSPPVPRRSLPMNQPEPSRNHRQEGQVLIMVAVASAILLAFAALAVDAGLAMAERRGAQNTADAASMAVARAMVDGAELQELEETAEYYGELNGYEVILENVAIDQDGRTVEIVVQVDVPRIFLGAFYDGDWSVSTSAEASLSAVQEPYAMIALGEDPNCQNNTGIRFSGGGNAEITIQEGSIGSNACIRTDGNFQNDILVDGNVEALHGINDSHGNIVVPPGNSIRSRNSPIEDPFDHWIEPTCSANGTVTDDPNDNRGVILTPGTHSGFPGGNTRRINLLPGVYCIDDRATVGSNMVVRSVDADYEETGQVGDGGGVLLVMTGNNGELRFNGQGSLQVRSIAYLNPSFAGCTNACEEEAVIWVSQTSCRDMDAKGGSSTAIRGVIYAPCSDVSIGGNPDTNVLEGMIVAESVEIHGNAQLNLVANQDPIDSTPEIYLTR